MRIVLTPFAIERVASTSLNGAAEVNSKSYQAHYPAAFGPSFSLRFQDFFTEASVCAVLERPEDGVTKQSKSPGGRRLWRDRSRCALRRPPLEGAFPFSGARLRARPGPRRRGFYFVGQVSGARYLSPSLARSLQLYKPQHRFI